MCVCVCVRRRRKRFLRKAIRQTQGLAAVKPNEEQVRKKEEELVTYRMRQSLLRVSLSRVLRCATLLVLVGVGGCQASSGDAASSVDARLLRRMCKMHVCKYIHIDVSSQVLVFPLQ